MLQDVTYADLKFSPSAPEGTRLEDLTYANVQAPSRQEQKAGAKRPPWLLVVGIAGVALVLLATAVALGVLYRKLQKTSEEEKVQMALRLDRAKEDLNHTRESKVQREEELNATWAQVARDWCPEEWVLYQGKCLFFSTEARTWEQNQKLCEARSSHLLITRSWQPGWLLGLLQRDYYYWIGLRRRAGQKSSWTWVDGSTYEGPELTPYYQSDSCVYVINGKLGVYYCSHAYGYICEKIKRGTQRAPLRGQWV